MLLVLGRLRKSTRQNSSLQIEGERDGEKREKKGEREREGETGHTTI